MWTRLQLSARNPKKETMKEIWTQLQLHAPNPKSNKKHNYFKVMKPIGHYFRVIFWALFDVVEKKLCEKFNLVLKMSS
jgi:hypothetical protein